MEQKIKGWIARAEDGIIALFAAEPKLFIDERCSKPHYFATGHFDNDTIELPQGMFPEITYEKSPVECEITIKINNDEG